MSYSPHDSRTQNQARSGFMKRAVDSDRDDDYNNDNNNFNNNGAVNDNAVLHPVDQADDAAAGKQQHVATKPDTFWRKYPLIIIFGVALALVLIILAIVLPLSLVKKREEDLLRPQCPDGNLQPRIDCLPDTLRLLDAGVNLESTCRERACCWSGGVEQGGPNCAYATNYGFRQLKWKENSLTSKWVELQRLNSPESATKSDLSHLESRIEMHTDTRLRIRIFPRRNFKNKKQRWEVPSGIKGENIFNPNYNIETSDAPFSIKVIRNSSNQVIFDTSKSSLIFSDQYMQITTLLSSPYVFGIGENSKDRFMHDMNYKTWPLFASNNHPSTSREKPNLYSQFPMYLNIEPDGNSHLVVFYNSNPSEFYLTPFPSLTFRSIGGIFDIYIFTGPTPVQAIEQFQQTFGLPKLPPYWSLGLQIGVKRYRNDINMRNFISEFRNTSLPFDSAFVSYEYMIDGTMFTVNQNFAQLKSIVDELRFENRAAVVQFVAAVGNNTQNYPFSEGVSRTIDKYWIMENFFSSGVVGKLNDRYVVYPDFSMTKAHDWWTEALQKFCVVDPVGVKFDGIFLDHLTPLDEMLEKKCPYNKWNNPPYLPASIASPIYNGTICMDSRHDVGKHYNIHGIYSHLTIEATAKAFETLMHHRTLIVTRHAFIGSGQHSAKWMGEYNHEWDDLRRSIIGTVEMSMFGFSMVGGNVCAYNNATLNLELCENWIKADALLPMMRLIVESGTAEDEKYQSLIRGSLFDVFNASLHLRYSLLPYFYTQLYRATKYGTLPIRPLAFEFPNDQRSFGIDNQWLWGESLMVTIATASGGASQTYLPKGDWYDYYRGFHRHSNGEYVSVTTSRNETNLQVRGGSVLFKNDCKKNAIQSLNTFIDIVIALNQTDNFTARGQLYMDDYKRKNTDRKNNYHRLIDLNIYRKENDGIVEIKRVSGTHRSLLSYRDLIIYGLRSKPSRITVNENTQSIDGSKCVWDEQNSVYYVNLQTEVKKKVLLDTEYLSFRWTGGFDAINRNFQNSNQNSNQNFNFGFYDNSQYQPQQQQQPPQQLQYQQQQQQPYEQQLPYQQQEQQQQQPQFPYQQQTQQ